MSLLESIRPEEAKRRLKYVVVRIETDGLSRVRLIRGFPSSDQEYDPRRESFDVKLLVDALLYCEYMPYGNYSLRCQDR